MTCTSCTDDARVKVPSFQKVIFFTAISNIRKKTLSLYHDFTCLKILLTDLFRNELGSKVLKQSYSSFLQGTCMETVTISGLIREIQLSTCN